MCKEAIIWYKIINKRETLEYDKLKRTFNSLLEVPVEKETEN
jgi:hypothetical protein